MYKKILVTLLIGSSLFAGNLNWESSYKVAKQKANEQNKELFLFVSSPTCPECNYMKKKIFTKDKVNEYINKNYISYQFLHKSDEVPKDMKMWGIPRLYISKGDDKVVAKKFGGLKADKLLKFLEQFKSK